MSVNSEMRFQFGIEAEYLLAEAATHRPLLSSELSFTMLNDLLESIDVADLPPTDGLLPLAPHRKLMPYVVEGYHLPDPYAADPELIPKGIEIRTPVCPTIDAAVAVLGALHERLQARLGEAGLVAVAFSHHPYGDQFEGPQGNRSDTAWRWAMQAMHTFGPDVNVSLPPPIREQLRVRELFAKVDYYAAAMTVFSLAAPLHQGQLWRFAGQVGKSLRTFRRSAVGEALELHPRQPGRLEFKCFEMTHRAEDFRAYLALWLAVVLDESLSGRADLATRRFWLQTAAVEGLENEQLFGQASELLERASQALARWEFDPQDLLPLWQRLEARRVPADPIIEWVQQGATVPVVLRRLTDFVTSRGAPQGVGRDRTGRLSPSPGSPPRDTERSS